MKTKSADILYCGVRKSAIKTTHPILKYDNASLLETFIIERYRVHVKKDVKKLSPPWTKDPVLNSYRFTNVKRYHDKETIWLIKNIVNSSILSYDEKLLNCILFRVWNKSETFRLLSGPFSMKKLENPYPFRNLIDDLKKDNPKYVWYTNAFNTGGFKQTWQFPDGRGYRAGYRRKNDAEEKPMYEENMVFRPFHMMKWLIGTNLLDRIKKATDQKQVHELLMEIPGFAGFLAYQVFVDFSYIPEFPFSENEFTVCGPGCKRGIDQIVEDRKGLSYEEILFWIRDNPNHIFPNIDFKLLMEDLPIHDRQLTVMDLENLMCEISKYLKVHYQTGRPKNKYKVENFIF